MNIGEFDDILGSDKKKYLSDEWDRLKKYLEKEKNGNTSSEPTAGSRPKDN